MIRRGTVRDTVRRVCLGCFIGRCQEPDHVDEADEARELSTQELLVERDAAAARVKKIDAELARRRHNPGM